MKKINLAIVGATGMVGQTLLEVLEEKDLPIENLYLLSSARSAGKTITFKGDDVNWGVATDVTAKMTTAKIGNGNKAADLEYFCMGNRGDMYRMVGFPKVLYTKYQINPSLQYDFIDIQYYYSGDAECVQKSPKTLTLVAPAGSAGTTHTIANAVIGAINTAAGLSIATIS